MTMLKERTQFGWLPDIPDHRDRPLMLSSQALTATLPARVDLTEKVRWPEAYNQGGIGSCVANAVAGAIEYAMRIRQNDPEVPDFLEADRVFTPSRLFIYYGAREIIGLTQEDSGSHIRDAMKVVYNIGAPRETGWKYREHMFSVKPAKAAYRSAPYHKITSYESVAVSVDAVRTALAFGLPVIFGVAVFDSFFSNENGDIPMPNYSETMIGGHAMLLVGYDDASRRFKFRNSWGTSWGRNGYGTMPYNYVGNRNLGDDYWVLKDDQYKERFTP